MRVEDISFTGPLAGSITSAQARGCMRTRPRAQDRGGQGRAQGQVRDPAAAVAAAANVGNVATDVSVAPSPC